MNIEHLVEPKIKDLEKRLNNLRYLSDIEHSLKMLEFDVLTTGLNSARTGSMVIEQDSGPYLISFQIQKL
jgi:hypothetical protein